MKARALTVLACVPLLIGCPASEPEELLGGPSAPSDFFVGRSTEDSILLSWMDNATDEDGYRIYRSNDDGPYQEIADLAADTEIYNDTNASGGVTSGVKYTYYVVAYNTDGESAHTAHTVAAYVKLLSPNGGESLTLGDMVDISWESTEDASQFVLYFTTKGADAQASDWEILNMFDTTQPFGWKAGYIADGSDNENTVQHVFAAETECAIRIEGYFLSYINDVVDLEFTVSP